MKLQVNTTTYNANDQHATVGSATRYAAVAQGFFVEEAVAEPGTIAYTTSMRELNTDNFLRTAQEENTGIIKLAFNNAETMVMWSPLGAEALDITDATYLQGAAKFGLYTTRDNKALTIQSINNEFTSAVIPMGYYALEDGENTISINQFEADEYAEIILIDRYEGTTHNLNDAAYTFNTEASEAMVEDRFEIGDRKSSFGY